MNIVEKKAEDLVSLLKLANAKYYIELPSGKKFDGGIIPYTGAKLFKPKRIVKATGVTKYVRGFMLDLEVGKIIEIPQTAKFSAAKVQQVASSLGGLMYGPKAVVTHVNRHSTGTDERPVVEVWRIK